MAELAGMLDDDAVAAEYRAAHESYLADRNGIEFVDELDGISAGGMPTRVKCLHALVAHHSRPGRDSTRSATPRWLERPGARRCASARTTGWHDAWANRRGDGRRGRRPSWVWPFDELRDRAREFGPCACRRLAPDRGALRRLHSDYVRADEYWLDQYGIRSAWSTTEGKGITIAVIDTGVDGSVPDLAGAVTGGTDFSGLGSSNGQTPEGRADDRDHGTMVASLAAGRGTSATRRTHRGRSASAHPEHLDRLRRAGDQLRPADRRGRDLGGESRREHHQHVADPQHAHLAAELGQGIPLRDAAQRRHRRGRRKPGERHDRGRCTSDHARRADSRGRRPRRARERRRIRTGHHNRGLGPERAAARRNSRRRVRRVGGNQRRRRRSWPASSHSSWRRIRGSPRTTPSIACSVTATDAGAKGVDPIYGYGLVNAAAAVRDNVPSVTTNPLGSLAAWIHLNRRAEPTAPPSAPPAGSSGSGPTSVRADGAAENPLGVLYPTPTELRNVGLPLGVLLAFAIIAVVMIVAAVRQFGRLRAEALDLRGLPPSRRLSLVPKILIVGGGYAGFYTALKLENWLRKGEAEVTIVDPLPVHDVPAVPAGGCRRIHRAAARGRRAAPPLRTHARPRREGDGNRSRREDRDAHAGRRRAVGRELRHRRGDRGCGVAHVPDSGDCRPGDRPRRPSKRPWPSATG